MKVSVYGITVCFFMLIFTTCFSTWKGDEGQFSISIGGAENGRVAVPWGNHQESDEWVHVITLVGPGPDQKITLDNGKYIANFSVSPGEWRILVEAHLLLGDGEIHLMAEGYTKIDVKPGINRGVNIKMHEIYLVGTKGPAEGIVFYNEGNYLENGWKYLEAAPGDIAIDGTTVSLAWASAANLGFYGTSELLGSGSSNTQLILRKDPGAPAAKACSNYRGPKNYSDWYLPSIAELDNLQLAISNTPITSLSLSGTYFSSSEYDNDNCRTYIFGIGAGASIDAKISTHAVRPIRQF